MFQELECLLLVMKALCWGLGFKLRITRIWDSFPKYCKRIPKAVISLKIVLVTMWQHFVSLINTSIFYFFLCSSRYWIQLSMTKAKNHNNYSETWKYQLGASGTSHWASSYKQQDFQQSGSFVNASQQQQLILPGSVTNQVVFL